MSETNETKKVDWYEFGRKEREMAGFLQSFGPGLYRVAVRRYLLAMERAGSEFIEETLEAFHKGEDGK